MEEVIIYEGRQQIVGGSHRMRIAGQMEIDLFHRRNLGSSTTPSTFHVEDWSQGWLTERGDSTVTLAAESHGKPNGCRCLPYA